VILVRYLRPRLVSPLVIDRHYSSEQHP